MSEPIINTNPNTNLTQNPKSNDTNMFLVSTVLTGNENYLQWKFSIQIALGAKKKLGFIDGTEKRPDTEGNELTEWISNDCMVRSWLLNAISKEIVGAFVFSTTAHELWLDIGEHFGESNGPLIYQLQRQIASINQDYTDTTYLRFLASNAEAGSIIGKGGSTISDFQSRSNARIQLSRNYEYFPGTSDRIIMVSGTIDEVLDAVELILTKLLNEFYTEDNEEAEPRSKVRLIVPNGSCGGIIGKGGSMIKSFIEDSQANIKISPQDNNYIGMNDRLVTVGGTLQQQVQATTLILSRLSEDPYYVQSIGPPFPYSAPYGVPNYGPNGGGKKFQNNKEDMSNSVTLGVADEHIGIVVGRSGRNITEISQISGARIKISERGDFIHGTSDRKVTITGSQRAINVAEAMIMHKVASASSPPPAVTTEK